MDGQDQGHTDGAGDEWWDDVDGERMRGWIPPDDRLWRHPSESGTRSAASPAVPTSPITRRAGAAPWIAGAAVACAVIALVATGVTIMTTASSGSSGNVDPARTATLTGSPTTEPGAGQISRTAITDMTSVARPSLVALSATGSGAAAVGTGIVVESAGIVVTSARLVSGARSVTAIESDGTRLAADFVGTDRTSGLAVLHIDDDLPAADISTPDPATGSTAVAMALTPGPRAGSPPASKVYAGKVTSTGRTDSDADDRFADSVVDAPLGDDDVGCPLLNEAGQVTGVLERTVTSGGSTTGVFLPAEMVAEVAQQIVSSGEVNHGWLGVEATDARPAQPATSATTTSVAEANQDGARLVEVDAGSPAATVGLEPGDVIVGVDGTPVQSEAELETRLYADAPGTTVKLTVVRDGTTMTASVMLAEPRSDVTESSSSP